MKAALLDRLKTHRFWSSSAADKASIYERTIEHQQVNDACLVSVARDHSGMVATLDSRMRLHADTAGIVEVIKTSEVAIHRLSLAVHYADPLPSRVLPRHSRTC